MGNINHHLKIRGDIIKSNVLTGIEINLDNIFEDYIEREPIQGREGFGDLL